VAAGPARLRLAALAAGVCGPAAARRAGMDRAARLWAVLYGRIIPGLPYTLLNYVAGATRLRVAAFAAATAIGVAPRSFAYTALGGSRDDLGSPEAIVAVVLLVLMAVAGAVALHRESAATAAGSGTATSTRGRRSAGPR
jgi:uncharacterized membrane protein YdjX (TVP38/TMEM64 family)